MGPSPAARCWRGKALAEQMPQEAARENKRGMSAELFPQPFWEHGSFFKATKPRFLCKHLSIIITKTKQAVEGCKKQDHGESLMLFPQRQVLEAPSEADAPRMPSCGHPHAEDARSREVKGRDTDTLGGQKTTCMLEGAIQSNAGSPVWSCWCPAAPSIPLKDATIKANL